MKYLVLIGVLLVVYLLWRQQRKDERSAKSSRNANPQPPASPQDMIACPVCHVHLPRADALEDARGRLYCCADHRQKDGA
jgi:uncharacterized protein